jgi:hypothetical protein
LEIASHTNITKRSAKNNFANNRKKEGQWREKMGKGDYRNNE